MVTDLIEAAIDSILDRLSGSSPSINSSANLVSAYDARSDQASLSELLNTYYRVWASFPFNSTETCWRLSLALSEGALEIQEFEGNSQLLKPLAEIAFSLLVTEPAFMGYSVPQDIASRSLIQQEEVADELRYHIQVVSNDGIQEMISGVVFGVLTGVLETLPQSMRKITGSTNHLATVSLLDLIDAPYVFMERLVLHVMNNQTVMDNNLFQPLVRQLYRNILESSGVFINPDIPLFANDTDRPKLPTAFTRETAEVVVEKYFVNTPIIDLFQIAVPFSLPEKIRFEHMHILAGTGHGKTQTLQHLIVQDLQRPTDEIPAMVILDSQGDMLNKLQRLALFDPTVEKSLARRLLIVDPSDVEFAPSLNLFDIQSERLKNYSQKDREQVLAGIIEIYDYIFGGLLGAELTQKQAMVFRFLAQLMLTIPGSTIHTLRDLLIDASPFMQYVAQLPETARGFFETQFFQHGYKATREQILRRLYGVLQNPSFERMFASAENRLDLFDVLNEGGIVLVNTAKDFMKTESSSMFGRYIIALTFKAAMERAILPEHQRRPTFLWIDEASEYFDDKIDDLLIQARKYKLGLVMAHQYLGQLPKGLPASLMTNTSIKLAGGTSHEDAIKLSREMRTSPEFVASMTKERSHANFAAFVRNVTPQAMKLSIPFGTLENMPQMPDEHFEILRGVSRRRLSPQPVAPTEPDPQDYIPPGQDEPVSRPTIPLPHDDEFWEAD